MISTELILKVSPVCPVGNPPCTGYMDTVVVKGENWLKCRICSYMMKDSKRKVVPIGRNG